MCSTRIRNLQAARAAVEADARRRAQERAWRLARAIYVEEVAPSLRTGSKGVAKLRRIFDSAPYLNTTRTPYPPVHLLDDPNEALGQFLRTWDAIDWSVLIEAEGACPKEQDPAVSAQ
jgi:hypothetical protein